MYSFLMLLQHANLMMIESEQSTLMDVLLSLPNNMEQGSKFNSVADISMKELSIVQMISRYLM